ncbi:MAG: glycosyltransferase family 4 protein [Lewinellaceae bacterium]|nr:glycosyltransferase family 4 protein [Lewinellaceae bacterium]
MKVLVSNFGRQYCNQLLIALQEKGLLAVFFTSIAANKLPERNLPEVVQQQLRKRVFSGIPPKKIEHSPVLFALERVLRDRFPWVGRLLGDWFDRRVARRLQRIPCTVVISYENTNCATMRAAKAAGKITILDLAQIHHEDIVEYGRGFMSPKQLRTEIEVVNPKKAEALRYTDYVLTLSTFAAESMLRHGWPADRLFTVNLGVDVQRFAPKKHYRHEGPLRLLFVGTMTKRKGIKILLDALEQLPPGTVELTLIGPMADARDRLREHAGKFRYLPFLHHEELVGHYQAADVFVFPSLLDSWAQTVLEAMAMAHLPLSPKIPAPRMPCSRAAVGSYPPTMLLHWPTVSGTA